MSSDAMNSMNRKSNCQNTTISAVIEARGWRGEIVLVNQMKLCREHLFLAPANTAGTGSSTRTSSPRCESAAREPNQSITDVLEGNAGCLKPTAKASSVASALEY